MTVHEQVTGDDVARLAGEFGLGPVQSWRALETGSIGPGFQVTADRGRFLLAVRERRDEVEDEIRLLVHLSNARFPVPRPMMGTNGVIGTVHDRPALLFPWIAGETLSPSVLEPDHARDLGQHLARMHQLLEAVPLRRPNPNGPATVGRWLEELRAVARPAVSPLLPGLAGELGWSGEHRDPALPRGVIHANLFADGARWIGGRLSAILGFEMACRDTLALDLAIVLLAWCFRDGAFDRPLVRALLGGYGAMRPLGEDERAGLYAEARFVALRYTVSRIRDFELRPDGPGDHPSPNATSGSSHSLPPDDGRAPERAGFRDFLSRLEVLTALGPARFGELCGFMRDRGSPVSR